MMPEQDEPTTATGQIKVNQPKFQAAVPFGVREVLGIEDLDDDEVALLEAEYRLKKVKKKSSN